jgi:hypothetical protein
MHLKSILIFTLALTLSFSVPVQAEKRPDSDSGQELKSTTDQLNKDWQTTKTRYKDRYKEQLKKIEEKIKGLEGKLDRGDPKERDRINEELADLRRVRTDITQIFNEITASSGVKFGNLKGDVKDAIDDLRD